MRSAVVLATVVGLAGCEFIASESERVPAEIIATQAPEQRIVSVGANSVTIITRVGLGNCYGLTAAATRDGKTVRAEVTATHLLGVACIPPTGDEGFQLRLSELPSGSTRVRLTLQNKLGNRPSLPTLSTILDTTVIIRDVVGFSVR